MTDDDGERPERGRPRRRQGVGRTGARFPRPAEDVVVVGHEPPELPDLPDLPAADPLVGRTGARFASHARRARREAARRAAEDAVVPEQAGPVVRRGRPAADDPDLRALTAADPWPRPALTDDADDAPTAPLHLAELRNRAEGIESRVSVRPYVRTRGRTHARADLRVETLVSVPSPRRPLEDPEHRAISDLCDGPRSVAELAALLRLPLGVARILIDDMAEDGTLTVHPTADRLSPGRGPDREVMARVLRGLHRL
ncbi:DUF742 domain-containing protein [Actinomycetospora sp. TBRC 11914]|uniref:DUF742 domain-containing protein n=1 Tax=Actinomycetospora sp. TBRC 11914 TaxID=2729387 RepID=UPI001B7D6447|nr:DUF742 domain-containing protein [Actinomycetospora sp. TBRC 11914]